MRAVNEKFDILDNTLEAIRDEVASAVNKHGPLNSLHEAYGVIKEEFDEFWEQVKVNPKHLAHHEQFERIDNIREELVQIAAMCVRTLMDVEI